MGKYCMVLFCKNRGDIDGIDYFCLTSKRYRPWMRAIGRDPSLERLHPSNRICSDHFSEDSFHYVKGKRSLKPTAIPTMMLGPRKPLMILNTQEPSVSREPMPSTSQVITVTEKDFSVDKENTLVGVPLSCDVDSPRKSDSSRSSTELSSTSQNIYTDEDLFYNVEEIINIPSESDEVDSPLKNSKRKFTDPSSSSDSEGLRGPSKKTRKNIKLFHNYNTVPKKLMMNLENVKKSKETISKKLKITKERVGRLFRKVTNLKQIVWDLRKKNLMSHEALAVLEKSYSGIPLSLMRRYISNLNKSNRKKKQGREKYPEELRSFALTLQFYSSKAYNYVRRTFSLALPAPSTIRSWIRNVECGPGFSDICFISLKRIVEKNKNRDLETVCSLMLDEMAIKKQVDVIANKTWGYEDVGTGVQDDGLECATQALVLMVVGVNGHWKLPIGYFLVHSLTGAEKANIVRESLTRLSSVGVRITSVTCDGPSAHFTMATELGAEVTNIHNLKPYFYHPIDGSKIYIIFDACHMIKLVRNNWATYKVFIDNEGRRVDFHLIEKLHSIQEEEFCRLGNKLRQSHINWHQQKMKVNLATQTLSNSVADALEFLKCDINHPDFQEADGTIQFIRLFDRAFDLCNSRNPMGRGSKAPLRKANENYWMPIFHQTIEYIKTLKTLDGQHVYQSKIKTAFKGFCITITSLIGIFEEFVNVGNSPLKYIMTYKFSQDHIELFFCCVRSKNGWNNNPTAHQFYFTYKRLALNHDIKDIQGNCIVDNEVNILTTTSSNLHKISETTIDDIALIKKYNLDISDIDITEGNIEYVIQFLPSITMLTENVVTYISGFVVTKMKKIIKCFECLKHIETLNHSSIDGDHFKLLNRKNRGGLVKPSADIIKICIFCERKIRHIMIKNDNKVPKESNFLKVVVNESVKQLLNNHKLFEVLDNHMYEQSVLESHRLKIIKTAIEIYFRVRFFYIAKKQTESIRGTLIRKKLSKIILFSNQ